MGNAYQFKFFFFTVVLLFVYLFAPLFICFLRDFQEITSLIQYTNQGLIFKAIDRKTRTFMLQGVTLLH